VQPHLLNDPLQVVIAVVFDDNTPLLGAVLKEDTGTEGARQLLLQILDSPLLIDRDSGPRLALAVGVGSQPIHLALQVADAPAALGVP
jgi:hypothetical protein